MIESHDNQVAVAKVVLFGPDGSGKRTTLTHLLKRIPADYRSELSQLDSHGDTLLSVEIIPTNLPPVVGKSLQVQLVAATGKVENEATWQRLLEDVDGVIFTADSRVGSMAENVRLLEILQDTLADLGIDAESLPVVLQMNHRDDRRLYTVEELNAKLNPPGGPFVETIATSDTGIFVVLKHMLESVAQHVASLLMAQSSSEPSSSSLDEPVQFGNQEESSGEDEEEHSSPSKSMFSFPETKRTWDGEGPSPFGQPDSDGEDDKGGLWRRLAKPFKK